MAMQPFKSVSLLSANEDSIASELTRRLSQMRSAHRLIFKVHPSVFVNPRYLEDRDAKTACFEGVIDFAVVDNKVKGKLRCAVLDRSQPLAASVDQLLSDQGICTIVFDGSVHEKPDYRKVDGALKAKRPRVQPPSLLGGVSNPGEHWLFGLLSTWDRDRRENLAKIGLAAAEALHLCQEASLGSFTDCPEGADSELRTYWQQSRVDLLCTSPAPEYKPLLVVEMDGPEHEKPKVQRKEQMKEGILRSAGIPLIRVCLSNMPFELKSENREVIHFAKAKKEKADKATYDSVFLGLLLYVVAARKYSVVERKKLWQPYWAKYFRELKSRVAVASRETQSTVVSSVALREIFGELEGQLADDRIEVHFSENQRKEQLRDQFDAQVSRELDIIRRSLCSINGFHLEGQGSDACATAQLIAPGSTYQISIPRPTFRFVGELPAEGIATIDAVMERACYAEIVRQAEKVLQHQGIGPIISASEYRGIWSHLNRRVTVVERDEIAELLAAGRDVTGIAIQLERTSWVVFRVFCWLRSREGKLSPRELEDLRAEESRLRAYRFDEVVRYWQSRQTDLAPGIRIPYAMATLEEKGDRP